MSQVLPATITEEGLVRLFDLTLVPVIVLGIELECLGHLHLPESSRRKNN